MHFYGSCRYLYALTVIVVKSKCCSGCQFVLEYVNIILETCFIFSKRSITEMLNERLHELQKRVETEAKSDVTS